MTLIAALLLFLPKILIGFVIAHLIWKDSDLPAILLKLAIGVPLGFAVSASLFFIAILGRIPPSIYSWAEFLILSTLVSLFLIDAIVRRKVHISLSRPDWQEIAALSIVLVGALLFLGAFYLYSRIHPYGLVDAWTIWNFTPRFIFRENSPAVLLNSQFYTRFHPDYPMELGLNVAWGWFIFRNETSSIPVAIALLSAVALSAVLWSALRKWKGTIPAALGALLGFIGQYLPAVVGQLADPLFTLHIASAAVLFYGFLKDRSPGLLVLCGLLAGFSAWVKNEGILFIGVLTMVCIIAASIRMMEWKALRFFLAGLVLPLLVVLAYKRLVAWESDLFSSTGFPYLQLVDVSRWLLIAKSFMIRTFNYVNTPVSMMIILLVYMLLVGFDRAETKTGLLLFLLPAGQLMGYALIYLVTPHDLQIHINTSINRLIYHLFPLWTLWLLASLRSPNLTPRAVDQT